MTTPCVILYDFDGKTKPWNPIPLKIRYALEYKKIPYRTVWIEYPDIEATMRSIGAKPGGVKPTDGSPLYTLPVIADEIHPGPDGKPTVVTDSWTIAEYLDDKFADRPKLFPEGTKALQWLLHDTVWKTIMYPAVPLILPSMFYVLNEQSQPYFRETREGYFKKKIEEICPKGSQEWEETWKNVEKAFDDLSAIMDKNGPADQNPHVMGKTFSYADITVATVLYTLRRGSPAEWEKVKKWNNGRWGLLAEKCSVFTTET